jgi:hypothetical protein
MSFTAHEERKKANKNEQSRNSTSKLKQKERNDEGMNVLE